MKNMFDEIENISEKLNRRKLIKTKGKPKLPPLPHHHSNSQFETWLNYLPKKTQFTLYCISNRVHVMQESQF